MLLEFSQLFLLSRRDSRKNSKRKKSDSIRTSLCPDLPVAEELHKRDTICCRSKSYNLWLLLFPLFSFFGIICSVQAGWRP